MEFIHSLIQFGRIEIFVVFGNSNDMIGLLLVAFLSYFTINKDVYCKL